MLQRSNPSPFFKDPITRKRSSRAPKAVLRRFDKFIKPVLTVVILSGLLSGAYFYINKSQLLTIKAIEVTGVHKYVSASDFWNLVTNNALGQNILTIDVYKLTSVLRKNFQGAKSITVVKRLPNKLVITVVERTPLAIIYKTDSTGDFLIDGDGYVLGPVDSDSLALPRIKYNQGDIVVGSFVNKNIIPVSKQIIDDADAASLKISSISFSPAYTQLYVNDSVEVLIGNDKDKKQAIEVITALVKKLGLEGKKLKKIDLRYDKVIVLYD